MVKNGTIVASTSLIGLVSISLFWKWYSRTTTSLDDQGGGEDDDDISNCLGLPPHLKRSIYKEKRRKDSVRFLAMKKPMYDNIQMFSCSGDLLCTVSKKKAIWYVEKKNLAEWNESRNAIHLLFEPSGKSENVYNQSKKQNICVSCGDDKDHMRHYIVPYCYRTLFPQKYKTHMPHDIVILCPDCHLTCEQATQKRQKELERRLRRDPRTAKKVIPNRELHFIRNCASALLRHKSKLPDHKIQEYEDLIREYKNLSNDNKSLTTNILKDVSEMETNSPNLDYVPGAVLVVESLAGDDDKIAAFIRDWRNHFIESVQPRYMPIGWDVDSPLVCDNPEKLKPDGRR